MTAEGMEVCVYKSEKHTDTYAYLPVNEAFEDLPIAFRNHFGTATAFLNFSLHDQKVLAQADARQVLTAIREQGFYLQLPPPAIIEKCDE